MRNELQWVNPLCVDDWNQRLARFPGATAFHTREWAEALKRSYGFRPTYLVHGRAGAESGILPLMDVYSVLSGHRGISLPFTDRCDPLAANPADARALVDAAIDHGRAKGWKYLEVRSVAGRDGAGAPSVAYYEHHIPLAGSEADMFGHVSHKVRKAVRKAAAEGVETEVRKDLEAMRCFYRLNELTRRRHGLPPQPWAFFQRVHEHMIAGGGGVVVTARKGPQMLAASVFFRWGAHAIYKYGASDMRFQQLRPNDAVIWQAICWALGESCHSLSMGKTSLDHEGLRQFKMGWGAAEERIGYYRYALPSARVAVVNDALNGWHNHMFRVMPLWLSRTVGTLLYRHIA